MSSRRPLSSRLLVPADDGIGAATARGRKVVAGAEGATGAANDNDAAAVIGFEVVQGIVEVEEEFLGERIHLLGAVEGDAGHAAIAAHTVEFERFESPIHGAILRSGRTAGGLGPR